MIAHKLKNNKIALCQDKTKRGDAIQTIEDLKTTEFIRLFKSTKFWSRDESDSRDIMFTTYINDNSPVCKEFDRIYNRKKNFKEQQKIMTKVDNELSAFNAGLTTTKPYVSKIRGKYRLTKMTNKEGKELIILVKRKDFKDNKNKPNSVCIPNSLSNTFMTEVKNSEHYKTCGRMEIMAEDNHHTLYKKWENTILRLYKEGAILNDNR